VKSRSLARRLLAASLAGMAVLLVAGGATLSFAFRRSAEATFDSQLAAWHDALVASLNVDESGRLRLEFELGDPRFEQIFSGWYWQVRSASGETLASSASLWDETLDDGALAGAGSGTVSLAGPRDQSLRGLLREVTVPREDRTLRVLVAGNASDLRRGIDRFDVLLFAALGMLGAFMLGLTALQLRLISNPLAALTRELAEVQAGTRDRVDARAPRELAPLVKSLNDLLAHDAEIVARARAQAADLAHALKTPLSLVLAEAEELADERGRRIARHADAMRRHIAFRLTTAVARPAVASRQTPVCGVVEAIAETLSRLYPHVQIERDVDATLAFPGAREDLEEIVGNLLENACKWARSRVRVEGSARLGRIRLAFDDDGPGLDPAQFASVLGRGVRLDEQAPGSGLGLAIAADVAALYGGALTAERSPLGGLRVLLSIATAERPSTARAAEAPPGEA
jgi:signal transduction histidine kinase